MDINTVKSALLVALVTATVLWTVQFFAGITYEDIISDNSFVFEAVKTYFVIFMTILGTELGLTYIAQPKPTTTSGQTGPTTVTQTIQNRIES